MECPVCKRPINVNGRGATDQKSLQHHLWGGHRIDVIRSHVLAKKIADGTATEEDYDECRQLPLIL